LLHDKKIESKHGSGVVNRLSFDLKQRYPQMGVSPRNLWDMKKFYERFCDSESQFFDYLTFCIDYSFEYRLILYPSTILGSIAGRNE